MLPKYRGAAPIQWSVINGDADCNWKDQDKGCGVTVQELSRGKFDRGRMLGSERIVSFHKLIAQTSHEQTLT